MKSSSCQEVSATLVTSISKSATLSPSTSPWITEPTELYEEPLFWVITAAAAIAAGVLVYFLARPPERSYDLVFFR